MLARDHLYRDPSVLVTLLGLHDVPRFMSEPGATPAALQARVHVPAHGARHPLVYYGDEIAMAGGGDPDNRRDFPGGFPGDARNAFEAAGRTPDEEARARARAGAPAAAARARRRCDAGRRVNLHVADKSWVYARVLEGAGPAVVAFNTGDEAGIGGRSTPSAAGLAGRLAARGPARLPTARRRRTVEAPSAALRRRPDAPAGRPGGASCRRSNDSLDSSAIIHEPS